MSNYKDEKETDYYLKALDMIKELPEFCEEYFENNRSFEGSTSLAYCRIFKEFFDYLQKNVDTFKDVEIRNIPLEAIGTLKKADLQKYITYKGTYTGPKGEIKKTSVPTLKRIQSGLSSLWNYYVRDNRLEYNPLLGIDVGKIVEKEPVTLNTEETKRLLNTVQYGIGLPNEAMKNHDKSKERDYAIIYLFLNTGLRIAELVGIDESDIDFVTHSVHITRKGMKQQQVYFSDQCGHALSDYMKIRNTKYKPYETDALFLNKYGNRITERSVERMLDKYIHYALPHRKDISPHKLRSTYATNMLKATSNLELVSKALGHKKISTTQIYAQSGNAEREAARNLLD